MQRIFYVACLVACFWVARDVGRLVAAEPQRCPVCGGVHGQGGHGYSQNGAAANGSYPGSGYYQGSSGLPQGRRYYNGRYFGNLNNRYYGPQYGYF